MTDPHDKLGIVELEKAMKELKGWEITSGKLVCDFHFNNFGDAFGFMTQVAMKAEKLNHHPEWTNVYNKVSFKLWTHENGSITHHDIELAKEISKLAKSKS